MKKLAPLVACIAIAGCGSSGGDGSPNPKGFWTGSDSTNQGVLAVVFPDGEYWMPLLDSDGLPGGFYQGSFNVEDKNLSTVNGRVFYVGSGTESMVMSGGFEPEKTIDAIAIVEGRANNLLNLEFSDKLGRSPSLAAAAGSYFGTAGAAEGLKEMSAIVSESGSISASISNCQIVGNLEPHDQSDLYYINLDFSGSGCASGIGSGEGIASIEEGFFIAAVMNSTRNSSFMFVIETQ